MSCSATKNTKLLEVEHFNGLRVEVLKMPPFELYAGLSPPEEGSAELSDPLIVHLTGKVIQQVLQAIQSFIF